MVSTRSRSRQGTACPSGTRPRALRRAAIFRAPARLRPWRRLALVLGLALALGSRAHAETAPPTPSARYALHATLDPAAHVVHGEVRIELANAGPPLDVLELQLYGNARRDAGSVFQAGVAPVATERSFMQLHALKVDGKARLGAAEVELLPGDFTRLRLPLDPPLPSGESVTLEIAFETHLGELQSRSGHAGDFHLVAQWFPKLARRDVHGVFRAHPFERMAEFRADHAHYDLTVDVPPGFSVDAPGVRSDTQEGAHFVSSPALDMPFVACQRCEIRAEVHGDTQIRSVRALGTKTSADRQLATVRAGLDHFGESLAPYPYDALTLVTPPRGSRAAGMEYPGMIVTPAGPSPWETLPALDGRLVAAHELAHQWFHALVASDEVRWPVLDEGLTEWASSDFLSQRASGLASAVRPFDLTRITTAVGRPLPPPAGLPAYAYDDSTYGRAVYARAALALESVRRSHGDPRFRAALRTYVARARFGHGGVADLARAFDEAYGPRFFARVVGPLLLEGEACDVHLGQVEVRADPRGEGYLTRARAYRTGHVALPTWVALRGEGGLELARIPWSAEQRTLEVDAHTREEVRTVEVDPDRALLVDVDRLDQTWHAASRRGPRSWTGWLFIAAQALLMGVAP